LKIDRLSAEVLRYLSQDKRVRNGENNSSERYSNSVTDSSSVREISVEITKELRDFETPKVSKEKVEKIKRALKEGKYQVNPHKISEAIIREIFGG